MTTTAQSQFAIKYEIAPIILNNGLADQLSNGAMSILALTEGNARAAYADITDYFAHFKILPGGTLEEWAIAEYPFASLQMAANAQIKMPLHVSMLMLSPAQSNSNATYAVKTSRFSTIKAMLDAHITLGGTFTVATPSYTYTNCLLVKLTDVTSSSDRQVQIAWQWDFVQPLITQQAATQSYNANYAKLAGQVPVSNPPTNSGISNVVGANPTNQTPVPTSLPPQNIDLSGITLPTGI